PDNVLFEAGVGTEVRRDLMEKCNLHTILRLPTGIFYAQGVKTNVLFFQKGSAADPYQQEGCTQTVWVYDLRANMPSFGKRTPFTEAHLAPFEQVYGTNPNGQSSRCEGEYSFTELAESDAAQTDEPEQGRWRSFSRAWIRDSKGDSLDISWLKDQNSVDAADLPEPLELANEAKAELEAALAELQDLVKALEGMA
ncbi:MAG: N-6 DNA methylase, partial [Aeromonas sp.]